eukprot:XP_025012903.1 uncharacterized protein LOC8262110 isoform X3 [Ricinus communis]
MATLNNFTSHKLLTPIRQSHQPNSSSLLLSTAKPKSSKNKYTKRWAIGSVTEDREVAPVKDSTSKYQGNPLFVNGSKDFEALPSSSVEEKGGGDNNDKEKLMTRAINASIVLGFGTLAVSKLLTIDHDYWHGWTLYEVLRYVPEHNWIAYEQALKSNPVLTKMAISGIVYSIGDWIAQCYEGKPIFEFDRTRMFRSGLVGFTLHGSLSHYYYQFCEAGWKLWPFSHLITYGVIPVEQRLLWVDCVELIWVTILSTYSNEKSEARTSEATIEATSKSSSNHTEEIAS